MKKKLLTIAAALLSIGWSYGQTGSPSIDLHCIVSATSDSSMVMSAHNWYAIIKEGSSKVKVIQFDGECHESPVTSDVLTGTIKDMKIAGKTNTAVAVITTTTGHYRMVMSKTGTTWSAATSFIPMLSGYHECSLKEARSNSGMSYLIQYSDTINHTTNTKLGRIGYDASTSMAELYSAADNYPAIIADDNYVFVFFVVPGGAYVGSYMERHQNNSALTLENTAYPLDPLAPNQIITDVALTDTNITLLIKTAPTTLYRHVIQKDNGVTYPAYITHPLISGNGDEAIYIRRGTTMLSNDIIKHDNALYGPLTYLNTLTFPGNYDHFMATEVQTGGAFVWSGMADNILSPIIRDVKVLLVSNDLQIYDSAKIQNLVRNYRRGQYQMGSQFIMYGGTGSCICESSYGKVWVFNMSNLPTDLPNIPGSTQFSVYPNPATDIITVETPSPATHISIVNAVGQVVTTIKPINNKTTINISALPAGMYIIQVHSESSTYTTKFFKWPTTCSPSQGVSL